MIIPNKIDLIKAMLTHVPFDGWTWEAMEQGAIDIGYEKKKLLQKESKFSKIYLKMVPLILLIFFPK